MAFSRREEQIVFKVGDDVIRLHIIFPIVEDDDLPEEDAVLQLLIPFPERLLLPAAAFWSMLTIPVAVKRHISWVKIRKEYRTQITKTGTTEGMELHRGTL